MNKKSNWITTAVVLVVAVIAGFYYYYHAGRKDSVKEAPAVRGVADNRLNVNGVVIRRKPMDEEIYTSGSLIPDEEVDLSFETSGKIVAIYFSEGSYVKKGQLLAKVNDEPLQAQLQKYEAQVQLATDRLYRQRALLEKDAVSREAYEQARTELAILNAEIALVEANIAQTELRAPFDGIIGLRNVSEGAYASPSVVVTKLRKISPLKIEFSVPERYASKIRRGTQIDFTVEGILEPQRATVYAVESAVDLVMRSLTVRAVYPNAGGRILPGRFVRVAIRLQEISDAIAVPAEAIVPEMGVDKVFLYKNGTVEPVAVTKGLRTEAEVQIVEGLQPGDTVITTGTLQLRTGGKVKLDNVK